MKLADLRNKVTNAYNQISKQNRELIAAKLRKDSSATIYFGAAVEKLDDATIKERMIDVFATIIAQAYDRATSLRKGKPTHLPSPQSMVLTLARFYVENEDITLSKLNEISIALGWYIALVNEPNLLQKYNLPKQITELEPEQLLHTYNQIARYSDTYQVELVNRYKEIIDFLTQNGEEFWEKEYGVIFKPSSYEINAKVLQLASDRLFICTALNPIFHDTYYPYYVLVVNPAYKGDGNVHYIKDGVKGYSGMEFYLTTFSDKHPYQKGLFAQFRSQYNIATPLSFIESRRYLRDFMEFLWKRKDLQPHISKLIDLYKQHPAYLFDENAMKRFVENELFDFKNINDSPGAREAVAYFYSKIDNRSFIEGLTPLIGAAVETVMDSGEDPNYKNVLPVLVEFMVKNNYAMKKIEEAVIEAVHRKAENILKFTPEDHIRYMAIHFAHKNIPSNSEEEGRDFAEQIYYNIIRPQITGTSPYAIMFKRFIYSIILAEMKGILKNKINQVVKEMEEEFGFGDISLADFDWGGGEEDEDSFEIEL